MPGHASLNLQVGVPSTLPDLGNLVSAMYFLVGCSICCDLSSRNGSSISAACRHPADQLQLTKPVHCSGILRDCTTGWTLPEAIEQFEARSQQIPTEQCLPYKPDPTGLFTPEQLCHGICAAVHPYAMQGQFSFKQVSSVSAAQQHIRQYGGVVSRFDVYDDFRAFFANATNAKQVYRPNRSSQLAFGHAVVLVGYDNQQQYWLAKNSWGSKWGDGGYFRVSWR
eukprot:GHUV01030184.1.p1 GENE.GHUV01030184.1~~GHUV01030184.1.p1  ORF type:complete len:224 (+),score=32.53 GHUV01030184.1:1008-1679(+)